MIDRMRQLEFRAQDLADRFPHRPQHVNKRMVWDLACPTDARHSGNIIYSRWRAGVIPASLPVRARRPTIEVRPDFFGYEIAAQFAELDQLVFHAGNAAGARTFEEARVLYESEVAPAGRTLESEPALEFVRAMGYEWGVSDGN